MKSLCILLILLSSVSATDISIEPVLNFELYSNRKHMVVMNSKGVVTALCSGNELLSVDSTMDSRPLCILPWASSYVLYEEGRVFAVKGTTLQVVEGGKSRTYTIPERVRKIAVLNQRELLLQSGWGLRLSKLYRFSLESGQIVSSHNGYSNWAMNKTNCYLVTIDSAGNTILGEMNRQDFQVQREWTLWGRPNAPMLLSDDKVRLIMEPQSTGRYLAKLELYSIHLKDGKLYKNDLGFTAGGSGDVHSDVELLENSKYDFVISSRADNTLCFYSPKGMHFVKLQARGSFDKYYQNILYQKGSDLYALHGDKLFILDLESMKITKSIELKSCMGIVKGEYGAYLFFNFGIHALLHKSIPITKPEIEAYPWQYGGELLWNGSSDNPWKFDNGRSQIVCRFSKETYISRITLLDCNVSNIQKIQFRWMNRYLEPINGYIESLDGDVVIAEGKGFYTDEIVLEIWTESGSLNTIGGIVFE